MSQTDMHPIKPLLDKISPSFCAAKWLQVTLRLQNGHNHSCHHPKTHKISLSEIKNNPSALHNSKFKKKQRRMMLEGSRPPECSYCWKVEDLPGNQTSDRMLKSADEWSSPHLQKIASQPWNQDTHPTYIEVSFSNICNFKCAYCYPDVSSKWMSEVKEHGPYPTRYPFGSLLYLQKENTFPIPEDQNPYLEAFWKWIPEAIHHLRFLRITGGEPLLSKDCLKLIDYLNDNPNPQMSLAINSNLGVPLSLVKNVLDKLSCLVSEEKIKSAHIYTSLDTWGTQAEYIRYGLDLETWRKNLDACLNTIPQIQVVIMVTFNALSVFKFKELLQYILEKRKLYKTTPLVDISILHDPSFLNVLVLNNEHKKLIFECLDFMIANSATHFSYGFLDVEILKLKRICEYCKTKMSDNELNKRRKDLIDYVTEYDLRKKTDFFDCFPEMHSTFVTWNNKKSARVFISSLIKKVTWQLHYRLPFLFRH